MNSMKLFGVLALFGAAAAFPQIQNEADQLTGKALVDYVNQAQDLFVAEYSEHNEQLKQIKLMDMKYLKDIDDSERAPEIDLQLDVPASFDARTHWPACRSIKEVRDQSTCGSCWAFGAAEAISDRICIHSNGKLQPEISVDDFLSCCGKSCGDGCKGGYPLEAFKWWVGNGAVTGGGYHGAGCLPYPFAPCKANCKESSTPTCTKRCQSSYSVSYSSDKHHGQSAYAVGRSVSAIQKEIFTNGPVETGFTVYEDFYSYKTGVYKHKSGKQLGGHAVKILGWGSENGTPYWLVANSWGSTWGIGGFFKMYRGDNECGFEGNVVAGLPR